VVGGCVQLGEASVPFAPLTEALRAIRREVGVEEFAADAAADVIGLLDGRAAGGPGSSASLFAHVLELFTQLGDRRGLLVVFEDMHWADASTRDLVAFLARNLTGTTTSMVLTYRTDDVHRRHPLRGLLSELERSSVVDRVDVGALPREDLGRLVVELTHGSSRHLAHRRGSDLGAPGPIALNSGTPNPCGCCPRHDVRPARFGSSPDVAGAALGPAW
jgi:hypothetical protein